MATWVKLSKYKLYTVRSDGAKFLDGERNDALNTSWLTINNEVTLSPGLYDELLIVKNEESDEKIKAWASLDAPFFDPREQIDAGARPIYAPGVIIDSTGAWGIANGVKQAGFGTDGKWIAGGGKIVSDVQGLRTYDKPYTDPTAVLQCEIGADGQITAAAGNIKLGHEGMKFIGELGPDKPMIELDRETGKGKFRGEVAGSIVAWDDQMPLVTTETFRQVNCSEESRASGADDPNYRGYSQVNASIRGEAKGRLSQVNASVSSSAEGFASQTNVCAFSKATGDLSQVNAGYYIEAAGEGSVVTASYAVKNNIAYSIAGGYRLFPNPAASNRKWHIFSNPGSNPTIQIATTLQSNYPFGDYGEYFESIDGQEIPAGYIVVLDGDKIRKATGKDKKYLGVISKTAGVILGGAGFCWQGRYLRGEFGEILTREIPDPNWKPREGETEENRPMVTVEVENPDYNPEQEYIERAKRPEWHVVGMLGQVHVRIDETVQAGSYIRSNNEGIGTKDETENGWYVMKITTPYDEAKGYGVALVLVK